ncbi:MAG: ribonuclease III [Betaproteobacteria bacterium]|nr:MAG: ribonuclease III [Betaproteobacteria bacterium]
MSRFPVLERRLGHRFASAALLEQALTHRSYGTPHNERLEFLGDGVLGCVIAEELYARFPQLPEGDLTRLRAHLVREATLAEVARLAGLSAFLRLGAGAASGGVAESPSVLADAIEAVYGAVFLDGGFGAAKAVIAKTFGDILAGAGAESLRKDPKTRLQEFLQGCGKPLPRYRLLSTRGPKQRQEFEIECFVEAFGLTASGTGKSRQAAEKQAAQNMLKQLPG